MQPIELIIELNPVAKARARTTIRSGRVHSYTPDKTKEAQEYIKSKLEPYLQYVFPKKVGLKLTCTFYRRKSKWLPNKETLPFRKSDLDNFINSRTGTYGVKLNNEQQDTK